jgi:hypothetical protein
MKKKVRFIVGAVGAIPAIGLLTPAATAAPAHVTAKKVGKTVALHGSAAAATCTAHNKHVAISASGLYMKFYSEPVGTRTCIGLINVEGTSRHVTGQVFSTSVEVFNTNGNFCEQKDHDASHNFHCNHTFVRTRLAVSATAFGISGSPRSWHVRSPYPFKG